MQCVFAGDRYLSGNRHALVGVLTVAFIGNLFSLVHGALGRRGGMNNDGRRNRTRRQAQRIQNGISLSGLRCFKNSGLAFGSRKLLELEERRSSVERDLRRNQLVRSGAELATNAAVQQKLRG